MITERESLQLEFPVNLNVQNLDNEIMYVIGLLSFPVKEGYNTRTILRSTLILRIGEDYPDIFNHLISKKVIKIVGMNDKKIQYEFTDQFYQDLNVNQFKTANVIVGKMVNEFDLITIPNYYGS